MSSKPEETPYESMFNFHVQFSEKLPLQPLCLLFIFLNVTIIFLHKWLLIKQKNSPPSPPKLPIIGHLHKLGELPHHSLASLSKHYGNLMLLHLGSKPALVVSSSDLAREIMKTQELIFSNRPKLRFVDRVFYDGRAFSFGPYGDYWRQMKGLAMTKLLSSNKAQCFRAIREEEVALIIQKIKDECGSCCDPVNFSKIILRLMSNLISRVTFGRKYSADFEELFKELPNLIGAVSFSDYMPWLAWIDQLTGLVNRVEKLRKSFDELLNEVIQEHVDRVNAGGISDDEDFVDIMLRSQRDDPATISSDCIKGVVLDIFGAATETTYSLLEWTVSELVKHPRVMEKLQEEVRGIVKGKQRVTEEDLDGMKYLKATIKETLRLHPPAPILLLRESSQDAKIYGYDIAAKTIVIINAWAIQRDPTCWEEPEEFYPERFLNSSIDFRGQHFEFIPFGAGRRGCPGISFGMANAELILASLVYGFDMQLPSGAAGAALDMDERPGLIINRKHPLMIVATPRA